MNKNYITNNMLRKDGTPNRYKMEGYSSEELFLIFHDISAPSCKSCEKDSIYISWNKGYKNFCSVSCASKHTNKVKRNSKPKIKLNKCLVCSNLVKNNRHSFCSISCANRGNKTRVDSYKKTIKANPEILKQSSIKRLKTISEKSDVEKNLTKQRQSKSAKNRARTSMPDNLKKAKDLYSRLVRRDTRINYNLFKHIINPYNLPRGKYKHKNLYQLDHKISINYGFENNIPVYIISNYNNLQMLLVEDNRSKYMKNSQTIEELLEDIKKSNEFYQNLKN